MYFTCYNLSTFRGILLVHESLTSASSLDHTLSPGVASSPLKAQFVSFFALSEWAIIFTMYISGRSFKTSTRLIN